MDGSVGGRDSLDVGGVVIVPAGTGKLIPCRELAFPNRVGEYQPGGKQAILDPVVGKSGVNHRLRKLSELADSLKR